MDWLYLSAAGVLETCWAVSLKASAGFTRPLPAALTVTGMLASFFFLSLALRKLPLGTAYAVWTGIGTVGTAILGVLLFHEAMRLPQLLCIGLIVAGITGLRLLCA
jgi:quaternary ammonium compound-resistance protein SugE